MSRGRQLEKSLRSIGGLHPGGEPDILILFRHLPKASPEPAITRNWGGESVKMAQISFQPNAAGEVNHSHEKRDVRAAHTVSQLRSWPLSKGV